MSKKPKTDAEKLDLVDDFMLEEILHALDEENVAETKSSDEAAFDAAFARAQTRVAKDRMAAAKTAVSERKEKQNVVAFDPSRARNKMRLMMENDPNLRGKLTLAARNATDQNATDEEGLLEDLDELFRDDSDQEDK